MPMPSDDLLSSPRPSGDGSVPLSGQGLRYALSLELLRAGELTVRAMVERIEAAGFRIVGRPSKTVSDALRWEVGHGRAARVGRGRYRTGRIPRSTVRWMQRALDQWRGRWAAAPPVVPTAPRRTVSPSASGPSGLTRYRRQQRVQRERAARLRALGIRPWRVSLVPPD